MPSTLSHPSESSKLFIKPKKKKTTHRNKMSDRTLRYVSLRINVTFLRETWRKCIGNCSTANVLCKQFRTSWWRGSCSISSEKALMSRIELCNEFYYFSHLPNFMFFRNATSFRSKVARLTNFTFFTIFRFRQTRFTKFAKFCSLNDFLHR